MACTNSLVQLWRRRISAASAKVAARFGMINTLQLSLRGLTEEFVVTRAREAMHYRDSWDPKIAGAAIGFRTSRKWSTARDSGGRGAAGNQGSCW